MRPRLPPIILSRRRSSAEEKSQNRLAFAAAVGRMLVDGDAHARQKHTTDNQTSVGQTRWVWRLSAEAHANPSGRLDNGSPLLFVLSVPGHIRRAPSMARPDQPGIFQRPDQSTGREYSAAVPRCHSCRGARRGFPSFPPARPGGVSWGTMPHGPWRVSCAQRGARPPTDGEATEGWAPGLLRLSRTCWRGRAHSQGRRP